ncbi:MAG: hypothetical protein RLZZ08_2133 [Pseudomonadota bacterium]|jgi:hypothetical protein
MKRLIPLAALVLAAGCVAIPGGPVAEGPPALAAGSAATLGQPVWVGKLIVTPAGVIEDSRCPKNARCVWAGRLIVNARIDGNGWRQTAPLTLGEPYALQGTSVTLVSGTPEKMAGEQGPAQGPAQADHFTFEGGK